MKMFFLILTILSINTLWANTVYEFKGKAIRENGELAYNETHKITFSDEKKILLTETTYYKDGKKIAYLYNNYENHPYVPKHKFEDFRFDYDYGIRLKDKTYVMFNNDGENKKTEEIELNKNSISSQGFNTYLSSKLNEIEDDEVFDFIIPGKMTRVNFRVKKKSKNELTRFILEADSFFIRLLAPKMTIDYSKDGKIRYYKGPSNLPDENEESQNVEISYQYPDEG